MPTPVPDLSESNEIFFSEFRPESNTISVFSEQHPEGITFNLPDPIKVKFEITDEKFINDKDINEDPVMRGIKRVKDKGFFFLYNDVQEIYFSDILLQIFSDMKAEEDSKRVSIPFKFGKDDGSDEGSDDDEPISM